jgi:hypothetical protein
MVGASKLQNISLPVKILSGLLPRQMPG